MLRWTVLLVALCAWGCGHAERDSVHTQTAVQIAAEPARTGTIRTSILAAGMVEAALGAELIVIAPEPAKIAELRVAEGDPVRRGDLLVRFEAAGHVAEALGRRAELDLAEARLLAARAADARARDLFERGLIPRNQVEEAGRELADAETALEYARAASNETAIHAERFQVSATFDGIVAARYHDEGDVVQASAEDPVLRIVDPRRLEVTASIPIGDAPSVVPGAKAQVVGGDAEWLTVVSRPVSFDPGATTAPVRLACDVDTKLVAGTVVRLEIEVEERPDTVMVPRSAVVRDEGETVVFVAAGGRAERRTVVVGSSDGGDVELRSGVEAGELVVTRGQAELNDGAAVLVVSPAR